ncbi:caspase family protein [uncultured Sphaerochaeta sp.]|uniref:caspase family protein n=1 Tax=uncultured Sphaerochaeta sp. TaxID=886478 RepID=UPI002A0A8D7B|nr:caspase family protein [uncultured Sphaerochaeta sp.]
MKKHLVLLLLLSLLLLTSCELFTEEPAKGKVNYVVIGLDYKNDNSSSDDLKGTLNDAKEMSTTLDALITKTDRPKGTAYLMIQEGSDIATSDPLYPSITNVETKLAELKDSAADNDLTIFFYSGHGEENTGKLVLATTDGLLHGEDRMAPLTLLSLMNDIPGKKLLLLDSCYSGQFVGESASSESTVYSDYDFYAKYFSDESYGLSNLYVLSASANNTVSWELFPDDTTNDHHHGVFTYALLEGLGLVHTYGTTDDSSVTLLSFSPTIPAAKDSAVTVDSLYAYVIDNQTLSSNSYSYYHQHPMTNGGAMDMVLFNY